MKVGGKPTVSRADLIRLYGALGLKALDHISVFTGYHREHDTKRPLTEPVILEAASSKHSQVADKIQPSLDHEISMPFWQPDSCKALKREDHQGQAPEKYTKAVALQEMNIRADPSQLPPAPHPLCPWSRMWPFQRSALGAVQDYGEVDIHQAVRLAAEMRPMRRLPRVLRRGWARRCLFIVETDTRLLPFWQDMRRLYSNLLKLRGAGGLDLLLFEQGPFGPMRRPGKKASLLSSFKPPGPGTPILIISDLGLFERADHVTKSWLRFGKKLNRAGFFPVVLTPAPRRLWTDELAAVFRLACVDRGQRLPKLTGPRSPSSRPLATDKERKGTRLLLSLLAPAIRVEPELLRAMRLLLPADQCDAGDEAAVWHHKEVLRGYTGFSFDPQHIADLRKTFVRDHTTELKQRACALIQAYHRHLSPAVVKEERLIAEMLLHGEPSEEAEQFFWSSLKTILSQPDFRERSGLEAWMQRVIHRQEMDPHIWKKSPALCAFWAKDNYKNWTRGKVFPPKGLDPARVAWVWVKEGLAQSYTLFRRGAHFVVQKQSQTESSDAAPYSAGSPVIDLISSDGVLQVQEINSSRPKEYAVNLLNPAPVPIEVPDRGKLRLTSTHHEIVIKFREKLSWAEGWGRDERGLFIILPHGEQTRKAYWFNPGRYSVGDDAAISIDINHGFWWHEREFEKHLELGFGKPSWAHRFGRDKYGLYADFKVKGVTQRMRWIMPGKFMMGSPQSEPERLDDEQQHKVILTRGFWLAETACTQALWLAVMEDNPSSFKGDDRPVDSVSWNDAQAFIKNINTDIPSLELHLPTEAQWEYACRAGTATPFHFGSTITTDQANFNGNYPYNKGPKGESRKKTVSVKTFSCNAWGLYEMHGNVWEWCQDWYGAYPKNTIVDPTGPNEGESRVLRGGSWFDYGRDVRSAGRRRNEPAVRHGSHGLRLARGRTAGQGSGGAGQSRPKVPG
jgi:formylglycine-generating enzyme required for sulfatase activity